MISSIKLTKGFITLLDLEDAIYLMQWKWYCNDKGYAVRNDYVDGKRTTIYMHLVLAKRMGLIGRIDHKNRDPLDNTRDNIRIATVSENNTNRDLQKNNTSGFKGVAWNIKREKWRASIRVDCKTLHYGYFDSKEEAARAYDRAAKIHFPIHCALNFPD